MQPPCAKTLRQTVPGKCVANELLVGNVAFDELECWILQQLLKALLLKADIVIVVHVVDADNNILGRCIANPFYQVGAYETCGSCDQNGFHLIFVTSLFVYILIPLNPS